MIYVRLFLGLQSQQMPFLRVRLLFSYYFVRWRHNLSLYCYRKGCKSRPPCNWRIQGHLADSSLPGTRWTSWWIPVATLQFLKQCHLTEPYLRMDCMAKTRAFGTSRDDNWSPWPYQYEGRRAPRIWSRCFEKTLAAPQVLRLWGNYHKLNQFLL